MLPSPGFSIPSIGTPVHQPEEDQQILQMPPLQPQGLTMSTSSLPSQQQSMNKIYQTNNMGYATPHSMMHSQTPVRIFLKCNILFLVEKKHALFLCRCIKVCRL